MFVISSHALAREVLRDPSPGLCISVRRAAHQVAGPGRFPRMHFDSAMLVRALLQEAGEPFSIKRTGCLLFPLSLGNGDWYSVDEEEALRVRLANRLLAAPDRRLVVPKRCGEPVIPAYIETR